MERPVPPTGSDSNPGLYVNRKQIVDHWDEVLRLATSIKHGSVTASLTLRKLGAYPRQNGMAAALQELGKIERTFVPAPVH
jgi:TnpA family transposase